MTEMPQVSEPAGLCKLTKVVVVSFKYVHTETNADAECLIGKSQGSSRSIGEVPVSSNEVELVSKVVNIQIKIVDTFLISSLCYIPRGSLNYERSDAEFHQAFWGLRKDRQ